MIGLILIVCCKTVIIIIIIIYYYKSMITRMFENHVSNVLIKAFQFHDQ